MIAGTVAGLEEEYATSCRIKGQKKHKRIWGRTRGEEAKDIGAIEDDLSR
jgi:hypothetical protein